MTLYMVVRLASGEAHIALKTPLRGQTCEQAKINTNSYTLIHEQFDAGAKLVTLFCTGPAAANANPLAASAPSPANEDRPRLPAPSAVPQSQHPASP